MKREEETKHPCYKPVRKTKKHIAEEAKRFSFLYPSFIYGAEWAEKIMLDRACEWLSIYYPNIDRMGIDEFITAFRRAMKGGSE